MPTNDERGIVSKSKLTALATKIKVKAGVSGKKTLDELVEIVDDIGGGGSSGLSAPYISASGIYTPASDTSSLTIPLGVTISNYLLIEGHVLNQDDYLSADNNFMGLGFIAPNQNAVVPTGINALKQTLCVAYSTSTHRDYYTSGTSISISGSNLIVSHTKIIFKAGVPIRYLVIGYDGTDG